MFGIVRGVEKFWETAIAWFCDELDSFSMAYETTVITACLYLRGNLGRDETQSSRILLPFLSACKGKYLNLKYS